MSFQVKGIIGRVTIDQPYVHLRASHDGNCLFHAAGFLLERLGLLQGEDGDAAELRAKVVKWIKETLLAADGRHVGMAAHIFGLTGRDAPDTDIEQQQVIQRYLDVMGADKTWGDTLCVYALEQMYGVAIEVYGLPGKAPLYTPSVWLPTHTLMLVCPAARDTVSKLVSGRTCHNHFDPLVPATDLATLSPSITHDPGSERDRRPWKYWVHGDGLELYGPPVCHSQYHVSALLFKERPKKSFFSAFSSTVNIDVGKIAARVHLVNRKEDEPIFSDACTANGADEAFRPVFLCPLERRGGRVTPDLDIGSIEVLFALKASKKTHVCFQIYPRGTSTPAVQVRMTMAEAKERKRKLDIASGELYEDLEPILLAATDVLSVEQWGALSWEDSPYQLVVAPCGEADEPDLLSAAWTYFQVPCPWDVDIVEAYTDERAILLGDRLTSLASVDVATIEPRTEETDAEISLSVEEQAIVALAMQGLGEEQSVFSKHVTNAIVEREDGLFFAATSWASMIVLKRSAKTGLYCAHSLYYHSAGRALYVLRRGALELAAELAEASRRIAELDGEMAEVRKAASEESTSVANAENAIREAQGRLEKVSRYVEDLERDEKDFRDRGDTEIADVYEQTISSEKQKLLLETKKLDNAYLELETAKERHAAKVAMIEESLAPQREERKLHKKKISEAKAVLGEWSIRREPVAVHDGVGDFDYDVKPAPGWYQIVFEEDELPLTHAVTAGISSCAGGVTFTVGDGSPEMILFWHVDAPPTVPVKDVIAQLWPDPETCPALRSIVSIHPSVWEMNKYRMDNLYPNAIQGRCETLFLVRGKHLYDDRSAVVCGSDYFGLDVTDPDEVSLVFTNDLDKRTYIEKNVNSRSEAGLSIGLCDFRADIYGDYRFKGKAVSDTSGLKTHLSRLFGAEVSEVTAHKIKQAKLCRLRGLGPDLFGALKGAPSCFPLLGLPCFALGAKGDQEVGHGSPEEHYFWRPGPVLPPSEPEDESSTKDEKEKGSDDGEDVSSSEPVAQVPGRGPHALSHEEMEAWCDDHCHMCRRKGVRARHSCSPGCGSHDVKLCTRCAEDITMKTCMSCHADIEIWDMAHNAPW